MQCPVCGSNVIVIKNNHNYYSCGYKRGEINSECGSFAKVVIEEVTKCTCEIRALFNLGCKCGWWEKEKALKNENNSRSA